MLQLKRSILVFAGLSHYLRIDLSAHDYGGITNHISPAIQCQYN